MKETFEQIDQNNPVTRGSTALVYKQETTLEEAAESRFGTDMDSIRGSSVYDLNTDLKRGFIEGAKWMQERSYSEEEVKEILTKCTWILTESKLKWFEQFKKK